MALIACARYIGVSWFGDDGICYESVGDTGECDLNPQYYHTPSIEPILPIQSVLGRVHIEFCIIVKSLCP